MSSNQESDKTYWEVRGRRTSDDPFSINSKFYIRNLQKVL
jgi:hypothetical protein